MGETAKSIQSDNVLQRPEQDSVPVSNQFCSVDEMQEVSEAEGWSIRYRQLESGNMKTGIAGGQCGSISLLEGYASRRLEACGTSPEGHVGIMLPVGQSKMWVNGQSVDDQSVFVLNSRSDMLAVTNPNARILSMYVPISLLDETACSAFDDWEGFEIAHRKINGSSVATSQRLMMLIDATLHAPVSGSWQKERECDLAFNLATLINESTDHSGRHLHTAYHDPVKSLERAVEFIEAHLTEPISIGEICDHAAASISKIERVFRREMGLTPSQYVIARRLTAARGELIGRRPEETNVAHVAMNNGFQHLGRFSGAYRTRFGESPSDTLKSS